MECLSAGSADSPTLVLLHGWGASKEIWLPLLNSRLSDSLHLLAFDLPGVGERSQIETDGSPRSLAENIAARLSALGIERCAVLGHSQGANVAAWLAQCEAVCVTRLVIVSGALASDRLPAAEHYLHPLYGAPLLSALRVIAGGAGWIEGRLPDIREQPLGWARGYMRRSGYLMSRNRVPELIRQLRGLIAGPFDLAQLDESLPVLLIHGAKDTTVPLPHIHDALAARPEQSRLIVYEDALHCPMDTHLERFVDDVAGFLTGLRR